MIPESQTPSGRAWGEFLGGAVTSVGLGIIAAAITFWAASEDAPGSLALIPLGLPLLVAGAIRLYWPRLRRFSLGMVVGLFLWVAWGFCAALYQG